MCIKIEKEKSLEVIRSLTSNTKYIFSDKNFIYIELVNSIPLQDKNLELIDCSRIEKRMPRLSDIFPGIRSFYLLGDILLINPKKDIDKTFLAEVILKLNPKIKTIFLRKKVGGEFRINELEFLGGEYKTSTLYKENGINFYVDISKVYVNPSLSAERARTADEIECWGVILDAFCGYGAFTLYLMKKCQYVVAGDLNIEGLYMLQKSISLNKTKGVVDIVQYDAEFLPFRDKSFYLIIGDNPTLITNFKQELCRVGKEALFYILSNDENEAKEKLGEGKWTPINEYSKDLRVFKGRVRCDNVSN